MGDKPNCYDCRYRRSIPGDAHSRCVHPALGPQDSNPFAVMVEMFGSRLQETLDAALQLHVTGHEHGIRSGWFFWPANFDPTWLVTCEGFTPKGGSGESQG